MNYVIFLLTNRRIAIKRLKVLQHFVLLILIDSIKSKLSLSIFQVHNGILILFILTTFFNKTQIPFYENMKKIRLFQEPLNQYNMLVYSNMIYNHYYMLKFFKKI